MKNKDKTRNYLIEEINQNELMSKKHKKVYRVLNYVGHIFILISTVSGCISISSKTSNELTSSAIGLKICAITARIKKYKSITKKKKKKHDKILSLTKSELSRVQVLISKDLTDSDISHNEFALINILPKDYIILYFVWSYYKFKLYIKQCCLIVWSVEKIQ